jgi:hypothetical protein
MVRTYEDDGIKKAHRLVRSDVRNQSFELIDSVNQSFGRK